MSAAEWVPAASAVALFRRNPEAFRLRYRQHLVPKAPLSKALQFGRAMDGFWNAWFRGDSPQQIVEGVSSLSVADAVILPAAQAYAVAYPRATDPFTVLETQAFRHGQLTGIGYDFEWCGTPDLLIGFPDGGRYVCDNKTTSKPLTQDYFAQFALSDQLIGYIALTGFDGFYINALSTNGGKKITCERFGPVRVAPWRVARWGRDMQWTLSQIASLDATRGTDVSWPLLGGNVWTNDEYRPFYDEPDDDHPRLARDLYEVKPWNPQTRT